jgi:adenine phosphoribosyltransferase
MSIKSRIRTIPDHPKPGVMFRDITTLLQDPKGLREAVDGLCAAFAGRRIDKVAGIEARGFILGGAVAHQLGAGFVPVRKHGKLPWTTLGQDYALEYGTDRVEVHTDAIAAGESILVVDDLIATGGTAAATLDLIERTGGRVVGCAFVIDLPDLGGSKRLRDRGVLVHALCEFEGD